MKPRFVATRTAPKRNLIWDTTSDEPATLDGRVFVFRQDGAARTFAAILNAMNDRGNLIRMPDPAEAAMPFQTH